MSIQETKSQIHQMVEAADDETVLEAVSRILASGSAHDILDDLTDGQLIMIEEAREAIRQGKGIPLADHKRKMEEKWPHLKSL